MDTMVAGWPANGPGTCTSRMVSVRPLPTSPPVANSACCCSVRSARLSDPTSSQFVPEPPAGRPA